MMPFRVVLTLVLAGLLALPAVAGSATKPKIPKVKTRIAKVQIDVSGYVEIRRLHDTTSDCFPGETWTQTNRYAFDTGRFVNVSLKRVTGDGFDPIVTSPFTAGLGTATVEGRISGYRTTNYCDGTTGPVKAAPTCSKTSGRTSLSLQEAPLAPVGDDDPAPIRSAPLMLAVARKGGGRDELECLGGGAANLTGETSPTALFSTSVAPAVSAIAPTGISVLKLFGIRPGQRISRAAIVTGNCSSSAVRVVTGSGPSPSPATPAADGDCTLAGKVRYTIRPRPKKR